MENSSALIHLRSGFSPIDFLVYCSCSLLMQASSGRRLFTREQKMGAILIFAFAILTVGLGFLQLRNNIYGPFVLHPERERVAVFVDEKTRLQQIDTDRDGLNDFEELNFYQTSPYIPDTDSDGVTDKNELDEGTDPICPEGELCDTGEGVVEVKKPDVNAYAENEQSALEFLGEKKSEAASQLDGSSLDPKTLAKDPMLLRQLLIQSGKISAKDLELVDDATLISIAENLLKDPAIVGRQ